MKKTILTISFALLYFLIYANIINVPTDQPTIQAGINESVNGDTVLVQPGTYFESEIDFFGKSITLCSLYETTRNSSYISQTIISGPGEPSGYVILFHNNENVYSIISGFTVTNSRHGIWCIENSNPLLKNLIIKNNGQWLHGGAGIYISNSSPLLQNVVISENGYCNSTGGCYIINSNVVMQNVRIINNVSNDGAGIHIQYSQLLMEKSVIAGNSAENSTGKGGAILSYNSDIELNNVTISNNRADSEAQGIHAHSSTIHINNSIIYSETIQDIFLEWGSNLSIQYSDLNNGINAISGQYGYNYSWDTGNISDDPLFVNSDLSNFDLDSNSPCIDAGDPNLALDPDGTTSDMGACYFNQFYAEFSANHLFIHLNDEVSFTDESSNLITNFSWDFQNDGTYDSFEQNPTFTYTEAGTYDVKLKISNATHVDSLIKQDYITVTYCPPVPPDNVEVNVVYPDVNISWATVDTTECGSVITPDGYVVLYSEDEVDYLFLNYTSELSYVHTFVAQFRPQMFYQIIAYKDFSRAQIDYLDNLHNSREKVKWFDVKQALSEL